MRKVHCGTGAAPVSVNSDYTPHIHIFLSPDWLKHGHMTCIICTISWLILLTNVGKILFPGYPEIPLWHAVLTHPCHLLHCSRIVTAYNSRTVCCRCESVEEIVLSINHWLELRSGITGQWINHSHNDLIAFLPNADSMNTKNKIQFAIKYSLQNASGE